MAKVEKRNIAVFIASPGDLSAERKWFKETIDLLNIGFGDGTDVEFEPLGWEDTLAATGRRPQGLINADVDRCDVFILMMYRRWGQEATDSKCYSSYTEEEYYRALFRYEKTGGPEIFVFFKRVDAASEADPGPQLEKVLAFRRQLEEKRQTLYRYFDDNKQSFVDEIDKHLRAYVKGELISPDKANEGILLPLPLLEEVNKAKKEAAEQARLAEEAMQKAEAAYFKIEVLQLQSAEEAAYLAKEGQLELARQKFVGLVTDTSDLRILFLAYEFFYRTGDLNTAADTMGKWLDISGRDDLSYDTAAAYINLGVIYKARGELDRAEEVHQKAMTINVGLEHKEGMADVYNNLGVIYQIRGELDHAEEMHQKAMELFEVLGHIEGMATNYNNLGNLYQIRGELDRAEEMYQKAMVTNEAQGYKEGMADAYNNLGVIYMTRGELDRAEEMHQKAMATNEAIGYKEGIAINCSSLGDVCQIRGELDRAEEMYQKALGLFEALGHKEGIAINCSSLGDVCQIRGELDRAEEYYRKALILFNYIQSTKVGVVKKMLANLHSQRFSMCFNKLGYNVYCSSSKNI